ncbi:hypothetical protein CRUP_022812 [Coryphaenoides rupestris]|nr:hypothetical protein CRUP_022812 [Coryphaenoides rupestris]
MTRLDDIAGRCDVIGGVGELGSGEEREEDRWQGSNPGVEPGGWTEQPYPDCPYLLLDVRDRDQYDQCHIVMRVQSPHCLAVQDHEPKNADGKIIIVYDEDERIASQAAAVMCQRGFENLFMLSGGELVLHPSIHPHSVGLVELNRLKVIGQKFGEGMLIGPLPAACQPSSATPARRKKRCGASQLPSPTTTVTAPTPTTMQAATERKCRFTSEDLDKIQQQIYNL